MSTSGSFTSPSAVQMSTTHLANVNVGPGQVIAFGQTTEVDFTGADISEGEDFWGTPGSALPLGVSVNVAGSIVLPDEDSLYDIDVSVELVCDAADNGKLIGVQFAGNNSRGTYYSPVVGAYFVSKIQAVDRSYIGDGDFQVAINIFAEALTVDAAVAGIFVYVTKR